MRVEGARHLLADIGAGDMQIGEQPAAHGQSLTQIIEGEGEIRRCLQARNIDRARAAGAQMGGEQPQGVERHRLTVNAIEQIEIHIQRLADQLCGLRREIINPHQRRRTPDRNIRQFR